MSVRRTIMSKPAWLGLGFALLIAVLLSPLASQAPDGLQRVAIDKGFADRGKTLGKALAPGYALPVAQSDSARKAAAGAVGVVLTFGAACVIGASVKRRTTPDKNADGGRTTSV